MTPFLPAIAAIAVVALSLGWRVLHHRRRYGSPAIAVFHTAQWRERSPEIVMTTLVLVLGVEVVAWAVWPTTLSTWTFTHPYTGVGLAMIALGLAIVLRAQSDLGASWRIGIVATERPGLVAHGLYRISRNPIYLGVFAILIGFVLLMPTVLSLLIIVGIVLAIRRQVQHEEKYLAEAYGDEFRFYAQRVGRFIPWAGRLR